VLGKIDISSDRLVLADNIDAVIDSLLAIGKDGGRFLRENLKMFDRFRSTNSHRRKCDACGLLRTITMAFNLKNRTLYVGKTCGARIEMAKRLHDEDDADRRQEIVGSISIPGWSA